MAQVARTHAMLPESPSPVAQLGQLPGTQWRDRPVMSPAWNEEVPHNLNH